MLHALILVIIGFTLLTWGADRFVNGSVAIARNYGVSPLLIGLTIVALGTTAPEIFVSVIAAANGEPNIGIGNAIGSNIINIGLVMGVTALIMPLAVKSTILKREFPILFLIMLVTTGLLYNDYFSRLDGAILVLGFFSMIVWLIYLGKHSRANEPLAQEYQESISQQSMSNVRAMIWLIIGMLLLLVSADMVVDGAILIAKHFGVSDLVIGLTVVAIGTSLPELAASVIGALKNEPDLAIGNILGSNMFNLLAVMGFPGLIHPTKVDPLLVTRDMVSMFIFTAVLLLMCYDFNKESIISRRDGAILLLLYVIYNVVLVVTS